MKKLMLASFILTALCASVLCIRHNKQSEVSKREFAPKGMVAYAASYSDDPSNEPQYSTQKSKTFDYLNLEKTHDFYRGDSVKVGIIDSGINYDHEDFMVNSSTKVKGDSKYYAYQTSSWVYYKASQHGYSYIDDSHGHGTNVAATVAAAINGVGGTGLAPNVELYVYKVTNSKNGYEFGAVQNALMDAQTLGLDVINMSFQSYEHAVEYGTQSQAASAGCSTILSSYLNDAYNAGITLVGAAGNFNTDERSYPGSNNHVINVGSLDQTGTGKAGFSNYGSTIDLVAPGYVHVAGKSSNSSYVDTSGTSFSAPLVTAAIALYIQKYPTATPAQIESALYASCDPIDDSGSEYTNWAGHGSLNVARFLGCEEHSPTVSSVDVSPSALNLDLNGTKTGSLSATVVGTNDPSQVVTWSSNNTSVATVSTTGVVTAKATGSATITATSELDPTKSGTCTVTVIDSTVHVTGVSLNKNATTIAAGGSETLSATVSPSNATNKNITWTSSNASVATVSNGTVTGVATGEATITATSVDGGKTATCVVTVTEVQPETLAITRNSVSNSSGGYTWYTWTEDTSDSTTINGKAEFYATTTTSMQFNKSNGNKYAAVFNTDAIPGSITKIEAKTASGTNRAWNAYVMSTACTLNGTAMTFGENKTAIGTNVTVGTSLTSLGTSNVGYSYFCIQENATNASYIAEFKITYVPKVLSSISVKTTPTKTAYEDGDYFDPTGLVITKTFSDSTTQDVAYNGNEANFEFSPTTSTPLSTSNTSVTISFGGKMCSQVISVTAGKTLSSISISGYKTAFVEGDTFSFGGSVTATYSDSSNVDVTGSAVFDTPNMTEVGNHTVTVSYTYKCTTKTKTYQLTISQGTLSSISVSGMTTQYQKNYAFSFDGTCTATFANGYQKVVTPTSISSPDMSTAGNKTITVSFTYNGNTQTTLYIISVNSNRVVTEVVTSSEYSVLGTITWSSSTATITPSTSGLSVSYSKNGTSYEASAMKLGSGSYTGTITLSSNSTNITKVVVRAKLYNTDTDVQLTVGGLTSTITSSYADYIKEYTTATSSVAIGTTTKGKRAYVQQVTVYKTVTTEIETDISSSEDCVGLEERVIVPV